MGTNDGCRSQWFYRRLKISRAVMLMFVPMMLGMMYPGQNIHSAVSDLIDYEYTNWANPEDARAMFTKMAGDVTMFVPVMDLNFAHADDSASNTWFYNFMIAPEKRIFNLPKWITQLHMEKNYLRDPNGDGPVIWPKYTLETMQHLVIDEEDSIGQRLYTKEYQFWRETVPALLEAIENGAHAGDSIRISSAGFIENNLGWNLGCILKKWNV
ncbi:hypothetical protein MAR_019543 [Mya arenaria]|uniref:Uncharacterized protein n=1 Tax=Mya arenaria TaxID=6604 RepID=A0ABY7E6W6_MYAAR|nr:hypothetical protein MAR_019543 [Mya arenaria]